MDENQMNQTMQTESETNARQTNRKRTGLLIAVILIASLILLGAGVFGLVKYGEWRDQAAGEEIVEAFMREYGRLCLEDAFETYHPDIREAAVEEILVRYEMSGLSELEKYLDLYFGGMELEYEIEASKRLSDRELEDIFSEINDNCHLRLDLSKVYAYRVTEIFSGKNGTLEICEDYFVGQDDGGWYLIAVVTDQVVEENVSFELSEYLTELVDEFNALYDEAIAQREGTQMENAYQYLHPEIREAFIEAVLRDNYSTDIQQFVERKYYYYGGYSSEYELVEIGCLEESDWKNVLSQIERYYGKEIDFDTRSVWKIVLKKTVGGTNGSTVASESFFMAESGGEWYIVDIKEIEIPLIPQDVADGVSGNDGNVPQPVYDPADSGGYDSATEAVESFLHSYENFDVIEAYCAFHPNVREEALRLALRSEQVDSAEEYGELMHILFDDSLSVTYTLVDVIELTDEDAALILPDFWEKFGVEADISQACFYDIIEHYEGTNLNVEREEVLLLGTDGGKWFIYYSDIIQPLAAR